MTKALLDNHAAILRREGLVAAGLRLTLGIEAREPVVIEQRWGAACVPGAAELDALRLTLGDRFVGEERDGALPPRVTEIAVTLLDCAPDGGTQLPLFGAGIVRQREAVGHLLTRLHALLGPMGVVEDVPVAAHLPEERWQTRPYDAARIGTPPAPAPTMRSIFAPVAPGNDPLPPAGTGHRRLGRGATDGARVRGRPPRCPRRRSARTTSRGGGGRSAASTAPTGSSSPPTRRSISSSRTG